MALTLAAATDSAILSVKTSLTAAVAAAGTTLPVASTDGFRSGSKSISSLTSSGTTATATCSAAHRLQTGDFVTVAGAAQTEYNGLVQVTVTSATVFTYTFAGSVTTPATGTITAVHTEFILLGEVGQEGTEIVTASNVASSLSLTVGACAFAHAAGTSIYRLPYNQRVFYTASTRSGTYTALTGGAVGMPIDFPPKATLNYTGSNAWFKATYKNSVTGAETNLADAEPFAAYGGQYVSLDLAKEYLEADGTDDTIIMFLLQAAESAVNRYCLGDPHGTLLSLARTERVNGGVDALVMRHGPITAVSLITLGNLTLTTEYDSSLSATQNAVNVVSMDGKIVYLDTILGEQEVISNQRMVPNPLRNRKTVSVTYTAGFVETPEDVQLAVLKMLSRFYSKDVRFSEGVMEFKIGSKMVKLRPLSPLPAGTSEVFLSPDIQTLLSPYKRYFQE